MIIEIHIEIHGDHAEVVSYSGSETFVQIPERYQGFPVTVIGERAFERSNVESVQLPDTVVEIRPFAFRFSQLFSINMENLRNIGEEAFRGTKLVDVTLPSGVSLGDGVFHHCHRLYSVSIPNTLSISLDKHFTGLHVREIHFGGIEKEFRQRIPDRLEQDHPVFFFLDSNGDEYKEILQKVTTPEFAYTVFEDGIRIDKAFGKKIDVPEFISGYYVVEVGDAAFLEAESVYIPETVMNAPYAFMNCGCHYISIPTDLWIEPTTIPKGCVVKRY